MTTSTHAPPHTISGRALTINFVAGLTLVVQFLLGMAVNLFVVIPAHHPGAKASNFFAGVGSAIVWAIPHGAIWLALHVLLGLVLVVASLANLALAPRLASKPYTATATIAALAIIGAAFNGASFVNYGHDFSSMLMAGLWALALSCYLTCGYLAARLPPAN